VATTTTRSEIATAAANETNKSFSTCSGFNRHLPLPSRISKGNAKGAFCVISVTWQRGLVSWLLLFFTHAAQVSRFVTVWSLATM
jgi:hypothetical protein